MELRSVRQQAWHCPPCDLRLLSGRQIPQYASAIQFMHRLVETITMTTIDTHHSEQDSHPNINGCYIHEQFNASCTSGTEPSAISSQAAGA
jgi:hypothetical protein